MKKISLILFILLFIVSCDLFSEPTPQQIENDNIKYLKNCLPENAKMTKYLGKYWCYFELDGKTFLYHRSRSGNYSSYEALTQVQ